MLRDPARHDVLTISRVLILMAGLGIGLTVFGPRPASINVFVADDWRHLASAMLIGFSLPGVWYPLVRYRAGAKLGPGSLLWLTYGLGIVLMLPPAIIAPVRSGEPLGSGPPVMCLFYTLPLMGLWYLLAALLGGRLRARDLGKTSPWTERFGLYLAIAWSPLGIWLLVDLYVEAMFK